MSLKATILQMTEELDRLHEKFLALKTLGVDDQPKDAAVALQDAFTDAMEDILAFINKASEAAHHAGQALAGGIDMTGVIEGLTRCNENWNRVAHRYWSALNSYERVSALMDLGRGRGGEWEEWTRSIEAGLNKCSEPMLEFNQTVFECWREIGESFLVAASLGQGPGARRK
jgi:hypothetical protein